MNGKTATPSVALDDLSAEAQGRLAEVLESCLEKIERGETIDIEQIAARHPDIADSLRRYLGSLDFLHQAARDLAAGGQPVTTEPARPLQRLGDYEIVGEIGRGGMGFVYEARQISLARTVALKVLPFAAVLDQKQIARFANESRAAAQLHHPNIVPVYAVGSERGVHYYSMQYVDGQPLDRAIDELRSAASTLGAPPDSQPSEAASLGDVRRSTVDVRGAFSTAQSVKSRGYLRAAAELGIQAAEALQHAHDYGVIHRDVKPSNLLIDRSGKLWITDFGVARLQAESHITKTGDVMGTLRYMSPEQAAGRWSQVDGRTDVYSLGITLYELLTLSPAFGDESPLPVARRIAEEEPSAPRRKNPVIPADLETIVLKAVAKSRDQRYASAQELADDLRRFLDGKPTLARRPTLLDRAGKWAWRHQTLVSAAAVLMLAGLVGALAGLALLSRQQYKTQQALEQKETHYRVARDAVDRLGALQADRLASIPGAETVRGELLAETLDYYRQFIAQAADDPSLKSDLAATYFKAATIIEQIGSRQEALDAYRQAKTIWEQLCRTEPADLQHQSRLALCNNNLGLLLGKSGDAAAARAAYDAAIELQSKLVELQPDTTEFGRNLALTHCNLGQLLHELGDVEQADRSYREAIRIQRNLAQRDPEDGENLSNLAISYNNRSYLHSQSDPQTAENLYLEAIKILQQLVDADPDGPSHRSNLALSYSNLGALQSQDGRYSQALKSQQQAIEIQQQLVRKSPAVVQHRRDLAVSYNNLGRTFSDLKQPHDADSSFRRAHEILSDLVSDFPDDPNFRSTLGGVLNNQGMALEQLARLDDASAAYAAAIEQQRQSLEMAPDVERFREFLSKHYFNYGRVLRQLNRSRDAADAALLRADLWPADAEKLYSVAVELAQAVDQMQGEPETPAQAPDKYADAAVELLRAGVESGYRDEESIARDEQLNSLQDHAGFQQLLHRPIGPGPKSAGVIKQPDGPRS